MENKLNKCNESSASLSFIPLPPSPPLTFSKRRSNSTPGALNLNISSSSRRFSENIDNSDNYNLGTNKKTNFTSSLPPSSPRKVNQFVESFTNSFRSPLDTLKKKAKFKLILRSNSLYQNSYSTTSTHFFRATETKPCVLDNYALALPKSPDSSNNTSNPLTTFLNFIKPFRKVSTSESTNENNDLSISPPSFNPLSFVFNNDNLVIAPPSEFANEKTVLKFLNYNEFYLNWINSYVLKKSNVKASYTYDSRIFYFNNDNKTTSWLPPPKSWSTFQKINPFFDQNHFQTVQISSSTSLDSQPIVNNNTEKCQPTNILSNSLITDCSETDTNCRIATNSKQLNSSFFQIKLPYGWEEAENNEGIKYYINHINCTTTFELPLTVEKEEEPVPRVVIITKDDEFGFGFVAGSEKPVIVRYVKEGGPSENLLEPGDEILEINGENVYDIAREKVISLIKSSGKSVSIKCCQPIPKNKERKSNILSSAKKVRLKQNPARVRFADGVVVNGSPLFSPSMENITSHCSNNSNSYIPVNGNGVGPLPHDEAVYSLEHLNIPLIPNVLKVFLENGQTKTFKYDSSTTVQSVLDSLYEKLGIRCTTKYGLICEQIRSMARGNKMLLLDPNEYLSNVAARPNAHNLRCIFRLVYMLPEPVHLLSSDQATFEYLYQQCCNDIVHERYQPEIKYEMALRLSALRIFEHSVENGFMENSKNGKVNLKRLDAECGLDHFVPASLYQSMKRKELIRVLSQSMKLNAATLTSPGQKKMTPLTCKLQFLKILSDLPCYGGKTYANNFRNSNKTFANSLNLSKNENGKTNLNENILSDQVEVNGQNADKENNKTDTAKLSQNTNQAFSSEKSNTLSNRPLVNESTILLSPKYGLSFFSNTHLAPVSVVRLEDINMVKVTRNENSSTEMNIDIYGTPAHGTSGSHGTKQMHPNTNKSLKDWSLKEPVMQLSLDTADAQEFVLLIKGYHQLLREQSYYCNSSPNKSDGSLSNHSAGKLSPSPFQVIWECSNDEWWNDGAPRYYGTHTVFGNKWNYPFKVGQSKESNRYRVDLALAPPHYSQLSQRNKSNPFSLADITEVVKSIDYRDSQLYKTDYSNQGHVDKTKGEDIKDSTTRPESIDMPSLVSMEILESQGISPKEENPKDVTLRVTEMNRILKEAEKYLNNCKIDTLQKTNESIQQATENNLAKLDHLKTTQAPFNNLSNVQLRPPSTDAAAGKSSSNRNSSINDQSSSFALQTSGSRISTLDMLPQLLQAESDLAEVARSLQTPPAVFQPSDNLTTVGGLKEFSVERTPSPHRLSHLIASLEAAQQHLDSDVIDLRANLPSSQANQSTPTAQAFPQIDLPLIGENDDQSTSKQPPSLISVGSDKPQQQQLQTSSDTSRVVAELDNLCDTLFELKQQQQSDKQTAKEKCEIRNEERERQEQEQQLQLQQHLLDENLLFTFDQLTASINKLILEGTERTETSNKESLAEMVIPPPPPDSPTLLKEQNEIIKRFWEATEDVKTMITFRKRQQLQRQQQQQQLTCLPHKKPTQQEHQPPLHYELKEHYSQNQFKKKQNFGEFGQLIEGNSTDCTAATSGQFSSDSTAVNSSSDSESDVTLGNLGFQRPEDHNARPRHFKKHQQQQYTVNPAHQFMFDHPNTRFFSNQTNHINSRHYQHYQPRAPRSASFENVHYFPPTTISYCLLPQKQQQSLNENQFCQMMTANTANFCNVDINNQQLPTHVMQHPLEIYNNSGQQQMSVLSQTTPPPANLMALPLNTLMDLQSTLVFSNQQSQSFFAESSSASSSPPSSGNQQPNEMIYTSPFPSQHPPVHTSPQASYVSGNVIHPMYAPQQSPKMAPYDHLKTGPSTQHLSSLQSNRSQSLTLLPTSGSGPVHLGTSSTPPPIFPPSTPAVDLNSLLQSSVPAYHHRQHLQNSTADSSPPAITSSSQLAMNSLIYAGFNSDSNFRSFPKPPLPPSSPSIKEKRRQQQTQMKTTSYKDVSLFANDSQTGVKSLMYPRPSSPEMVFVNNFGQQFDTAPNHPPPPYHSPQHHQHFNNSKNGSMASDCITVNSPTSSSSVSGCLMSGSSDSSNNGGGDQYFLPGMGSTIVMKRNDDGVVDGETVANSAATNVANLGSHPALYHAPIPESKRICFQTKEMEEIFNQSQYDIDTLLVRLEEVHESRLRQSSSKSQHQQGEISNSSLPHHLTNGSEGSSSSAHHSSARETLIVESRHFVTASKFFVKCATEGSFQLIDYLTECVTLLERMFHASETVIFEMESGAHVTCLVDRLKEVAATYAYTVDTVRRLVGFSPSPETTMTEPEEVMIANGKRPNPFLDLLMNHATSLATCLSTLMRTLRTMS